MEYQVLQKIMNELRELRLYKTLLDKLVPVEDAAADEDEAIQDDDEYADEEELMKTVHVL